MIARAVPYLRTSTDDKGADPLRQLDRIRPWAEREGIILTDAITDEGTSAYKLAPFDRPAFRRAVELAKLMQADYIVVESIDRMSRQGIEQWYRASIRLQDEHALTVVWADMPLRDQTGMAGSIILAVRAHMAHDYSRLLSERVSSGMARAKRQKGRVYGRPAKTLTDAQLVMARAGRAGDPPERWVEITARINATRSQRDQVSEGLVRKRVRGAQARPEPPEGRTNEEAYKVGAG